MKRFLSVLFAAAALLLSMHTAAAPAPAAEAGYTSRTVTAYLFNKDDAVAFTCLFRDDLPAVPYISAVDYLDQLYTVPFACEKNTDGTFTISNVNGEMIVDIVNDTVHFESWEDLVEYDVKPALDDETADYLSDESYYEIIGESQPVDLEPGKYGIDLTAYGDNVYFPLPAINDIFADTYLGALYLEGELYFVQVMEEEPYYDGAPLYRSLSRDRTLAEYTYNELCFVMDSFYGCPPKAEIARSIRERGFDRTLEEYNDTTAEAKQLLQSTDLVDYTFGALYLDMYLDDGGHTMMNGALSDDEDAPIVQQFTESISQTSGAEKVTKIYRYLTELDRKSNLSDKLEWRRGRVFKNLTEVKTWDEDAAFYRNGDVGVFSFDEFKDAVVEPFKWSLDYAAENGIDTFIVDLSLNSGGSTAVAAYMLSVMCDDPRFDYDNRLTGNRFYTVEIVDKNLDGEFDERDDEVQYDLKFAVLTSQFSFSCANALSCLLQDHGVPVVGETSGGGTCAVAVHYDACGYPYALSDCMMMTHPDGTDFDAGAAPDVALPGSDAKYMGFYDFEAMKAGIADCYANRPAAPDPTVPNAATPAVTAKGFGDLFNVLWAVGAAAALICLVAFVIIVILGAGKKGDRRRY